MNARVAMEITLSLLQNFKKMVKIDALFKDTSWIGQKVIVKGWVRTFRANRFISLNDGSSLQSLQCVVDFETLEKNLLKK